MITDDELARLEAERDRLEQIAQQWVGRLRDDNPDANARWLDAHTDETDQYYLLYLLGSAVPDDQPWRDLTAWARGGDTPRVQAQRRRVLNNALEPKPRHPNRRRQAGAA